MNGVTSIAVLTSYETILHLNFQIIPLSRNTYGGIASGARSSIIKKLIICEILQELFKRIDSNVEVKENQINSHYQATVQHTQIMAV